MIEREEELREMFRDESAERLDRMVGLLLSLEHGDSPADAVDSLFREAHSIKGSAGMLGFDEVHSLAHAVEDVLVEARGAGAVPAALIEPLLRATDALRHVVSGQRHAAEGLADELAAAARMLGGRSREQVAEVAKPADTAVAGSERRSMRVSADRVDSLLDTAGELMLQQRRMQHALQEVTPDSESNDDLIDGGQILLRDLQERVLDLRTLPLSTVTTPLPRVIRDLAAAEGKKIELAIEGADTQLDRVVLDGVREAVTHLLRNAVAHGIESPDEREQAGKPHMGRITLGAEAQGDHVAIEVVDDGRGVAPELLARAHDRPLADVLSSAGVSTTETVTELSGRGVGLDAVRAAAAAVGGSVEITSEPGRGTRVRLVLPVTLAVVQILLVERADGVFGIPFAGVVAAVMVENELTLQGRASIEFRDELVPLADLVEALGGPQAELRPPFPAVVVTAHGRHAALACDRLLGEEEVVVKSLGPLLAEIPGYLGGAMLGDGRVSLIVAPPHLVARSVASAPRAGRRPEKPAAPTVLVVDDQFTVRELQRSILEAAGYRVQTARDGREAWDLLCADAAVDAVVTDIEMPVMDGLELLGSVRRDSRRSALPVVLVTSRGGQEDERRGLEAGADAYIAKERFDQQTLLDTIQRLVGR